MLIQVLLLKYDAYHFVQAGMVLYDITAANGSLITARVNLTGQQVDGGGFPCPIGAKKPGDLSLPYVKTGSGNCLDPIEISLEIMRFNDLVRCIHNHSLF
jgi:hypothetical protein